MMDYKERAKLMYKEAGLKDALKTVWQDETEPFRALAREFKPLPKTKKAVVILTAGLGGPFIMPAAYGIGDSETLKQKGMPEGERKLYQRAMRMYYSRLGAYGVGYNMR